MSASARERIVETALGLITEKGLGGVTMSAVADGAGVARQTLYNHFPDVESIVVALLEEHGGAALGQLETLLAATPGAIAKLEQLVRHSVAMAHHGADVAALVSGLSAEAQERIADHTAAYRQVIAGVIEIGVVEGVFRTDLDVELAALVVQRGLDAGGDLVAASGDPAATADLLIGMIRGSLGRGAV